MTEQSTPAATVPAAHAERGARMADAHPLAQQLRRIRLERGMTLAQVAAGAGVTHGAISGFECGQRTPSLSTLGRWAATLDMSVALQPKPSE